MLPHWTESTVPANGVQIHYVRTGDGSKPPLVLAHGFSDNGLCWLPVARDLEAEWDVILPDARGHGRSQRLQPGERVDMPADLAGLLAALGLVGPVVGGHSMGAATAAQLEARFTGLARALLLEDPPWRQPEKPKEPESAEAEQPRNPWVEWLLGLKGAPLEQVMEKCRADSPNWDEVEVRPWAESKLQLDLNIFQSEGVWSEWTDAARSIQCPTLLITADPEKGAIVTPESARQAQECSAAIQVAHIPAAGHSIRRENYPAYMAAVRQFLASL